MVSCAQQRARDVVVAAAQGGGPATCFSDFVSDLKLNELDTIRHNSYDQIRETMALIPLLGIRIRPPVRQRKNKNYRNREAINTNNSSICIDIHRVFSQLPVWHLCLAPTGVSRTRHFSVDCGRFANPVHDQIRDSFVRLH
ncbi:mediator of RNA polymerase II transcription subunit 17-like [Dorcoceras hygrometricum]|uniref:Mediator of RNA polymerase II transcription subunit 17-like n=1 Tax=Dorcoceras hygrometricum TaxID=472368 RepID=A0A2Z6ZXT4_9LAMI|nr:mediator of RNA polymerase II transcription subunit 17-like [Dorcoceras hygrometricum]